ncbi:protein CUSTOS isoform X1 [Nomascus leucogenys]|uniref:protein CUSTOS isoform X1 n=1 Tax=Nomascus leucogenys TaxID=61853 RepID=UPI00122DB3B8|nr:protein CUSTOS isoform X1 [Nomascus leucogenys]
MAAPTGTVSDSESSNDAEELERCREAAMPAWGLEQRPYVAVKPRAGAANNQLSTSQASLRHKVDEHEQDGNELQTTPEFRAHVAKKLGALLDSFITISEAAKEPTKAKVQKVASEDDGFRLFFTSVPGGHEKEESPQPRQKRQPSSSSSEDSDEDWRRCREAAVSASDILQESAIHSPGTVEKEAKKKRKLKKKAKKVASVDSTVAATTPASMATVQKQKKSGELNGDQVSLGTKKKKKKKAKKPSESSPFPPAKSATAVPAN